MKSQEWSRLYLNLLTSIQILNMDCPSNAHPEYSLKKWCHFCEFYHHYTDFIACVLYPFSLSLYGLVYLDRKLSEGLFCGGCLHCNWRCDLHSARHTGFNLASAPKNSSEDKAAQTPVWARHESIYQGFSCTCTAHTASSDCNVDITCVCEVPVQ